MVVVRFRFGGLVAFSFDGQQMEEDRAVRRQFWQDAAEFADVVAVDGTEIAKPKFLEENAIGHEEAFEGVFCAAEEAFECREAFTTGTDGAADAVVETAGKDAVQAFTEGADVRRNRHLVVVQDDQQLFAGRRDVVESLPGDGTAGLVFQFLRLRGAQRLRDGDARMAGVDDIGGRFLRSCEARTTVDGTQFFKGFLPSRQQLVGVGLMADIEKQTILPVEIEILMECDGQFDGAEAGGEMAALTGGRLQNPLTELRAQVAEFVNGIVFEFLMSGK